jgi:hypothetical protein
MGAEEWERIVRDGNGKVVQARFEGSDGVYRPRRQGEPPGPQELTGMGAHCGRSPPRLHVAKSRTARKEPPGWGMPPVTEGLSPTAANRSRGSAAD